MPSSSSPRPVTLTVLPALRSAGVKCRVRHQRYHHEPREGVILAPDRRKERHPLMPVLPHGGETTVDLLFPDGNTYSGTAKCSREDRFNRLEGIRIALERALVKRKVWQEAGRTPLRAAVAQGWIHFRHTEALRALKACAPSMESSRIDVLIETLSVWDQNERMALTSSRVDFLLELLEKS